MSPATLRLGTRITLNVISATMFAMSEQLSFVSCEHLPDKGEGASSPSIIFPYRLFLFLHILVQTETMLLRASHETRVTFF